MSKGEIRTKAKKKVELNDALREAIWQTFPDLRTDFMADLIWDLVPMVEDYHADEMRRRKKEDEKERKG